MHIFFILREDTIGLDKWQDQLNQLNHTSLEEDFRNVTKCLPLISVKNFGNSRLDTCTNVNRKVLFVRKTATPHIFKGSGNHSHFPIIPLNRNLVDWLCNYSWWSHLHTLLFPSLWLVSWNKMIHNFTFLIVCRSFSKRVWKLLKTVSHKHHQVTILQALQK